MSKTYWHFCKLDDRGRPVMRDGTLVEVGKRYEIDGDAKLCKRGYHGSARAIDALGYAPGPWVSKRPLEGVIKGDDKVVGRAFVQQPGVDATEVLRKFSRMCALDVINLWDAPEIVVRYLKTGDESIRAAADAAGYAASGYVEDVKYAKDAEYAAAAACASDTKYAGKDPKCAEYAADAAKYAADAATSDARYAAEDAKYAAEVATAAAGYKAEAAAAARDSMRAKQNRRLTRMLNKVLREAQNE